MPPGLADRLSPLLPELTTAIAAEIQQAVTVYGPGSGETYLLSTRLAITQSVHYFIQHLADPATSRSELDLTLQRIGRGEAYEGRSLEALHEAFLVGIRVAWQRIWDLSEAQRPAEDVRTELGHELYDFMSSLSEQAAIGYREAQAQLNDAAFAWRRHVLDLILDSPFVSEAELRANFTTANWPMPELVAIVAIAPEPGRPLPSARHLHPRSMARLHGLTPLVLYPAPLHQLVRDELSEQFAGHRIAIGIPVAISDAAASLRWARRALTLARDGVIEDRPVIDCSDEIGTLWLHAEPLLADIVNRTLLAPLYAEAPNSRRILAETLLAMIESPDASAPALAAALGRHPQTIRYRVKRVRELFGAQLDDPDRLFEMHLGLRAAVQSWRGEQRIAWAEHDSGPPAKADGPE